MYKLRKSNNSCTFVLSKLNNMNNNNNGEKPKMDEKSKMLIQYEYFLRANPREIILSEARKYGVLTEGLAEMPEYYFNKYVWNRIISRIIVARGAKENIKTYL